MDAILDLIDNAGGDPFETLQSIKEKLEELADADVKIQGAKNFDSVPLPLRRIASSLYDSNLYRRDDVSAALTTRPSEIATAGFKFPGDIGEKYEIVLEDVFSEDVVEVIKKI